MKAIGIALAALLFSPAAMAQDAGAPPSGAYFPSSPPTNAPGPTTDRSPASSMPESEAPIPPDPAPGAAGDRSPAPQSTAPQWVQTNALSSIGSKTCGMNADAGNAWNMSLVADLARPSIFTLTITGTYQFPSNGPQKIGLFYDRGSQTLSGSATGSTISIPLDSTNFSQFLHGFTAGRSMQIYEGTSSPFDVNLAGTSAAISALGQCTEANNFQQLPPPWHAPTSAESASAAAGLIYRSTGISTPQTTDDDQSQQAPSQPAQSIQPASPVAAPQPQPPASTVSEQPAPPAVLPPGIVITALNCSISPLGFGPHVQGMLTNDTGEPQPEMRIVEVFSSQTGSFVSTTSTFATYDPVLPGQASPFEDYGGENPVITTVQVAAATLDGEELPTSGQTNATCALENAPSF
jgi:hypothetical protein